MLGRLTALVVAFLLLLLAILRRRGQRDKLDHFRFYEIEQGTTPAIKTRFLLKGQLDRNARGHRVRTLNYFGVPVIKNQENDNRYVDPNDHLAWYNFAEPRDEGRPWQVTVKNQYTDDKPVTFKLDNRPHAVLVPTWKQEGNLQPPRELSHYKLYRILNGRSVGASAELEDQILHNEERVVLPVYFGVPVEKIVPDERSFPIKSTPHLVIYQLTEAEIPPRQRRIYRITNQFEEDRRVKPVGTIYLGVPTKKISAERLAAQED